MPISIFEMFRVGIGPSSSHTVGPMRAAALFLHELEKTGTAGKAARLTIDLMGSLGATGKGHATDSATVLGLMGKSPETVDTAAVPQMISVVQQEKRLTLGNGKTLAFDWGKDITFSPDKVAAFHTNGMQLAVYDDAGNKLLERRYYSVGGGFVVAADPENFEKPAKSAEDAVEKRGTTAVPFNYVNASELVAMAHATGKTIAEVVRDNERTRRTDEEIDEALDHVWDVMREGIERGLATEGVLPGPLRVKRRAPVLVKRLKTNPAGYGPLAALDWVNAWGFATGEENAAEIGMEHQLGLTCDPVAGQVQIPCIERNAVGAVKAINAVHIALAGDGRHVVSLDKVMRTMFETGRDMKAKYKETSRGGLAVCIVEC